MVKMEIYEQISSELMNYKKSLSRGTGQSSLRERVKNLMFTHAEILLDALKNAAKLEENYDNLKETLRDADEQYDQLNKAHKKLKAKLKEVEDDNNALRHEVNELRMIVQAAEQEETYEQ